MRSRPLPVTIAVILLALLSITDFPLPWWYLFPGAEEAPAFIIYAGIVLGIVGLVAAVGLWMLKTWSYWTISIVSALNFLLGAPGVVMAPGTALKATIAVTEVVAVLIIVLVVLPSTRRAIRAL